MAKETDDTGGGPDTILSGDKPLEGDAKVVDTKVVDTKVVDTKVADTKVADTKVADTKVVDTKVVDTKVDDTKVADAKALDSYSEFALPEGFEWHDGQLEAVQKIGKDNNLSQEAVQGIVDVGHKSVSDAVARHVEAGQQQWKDLQQDWIETIKKDPDLGGDNLEATVSNGRKGVQAFGKMVETKGEDGKASLGKDGKPIMVNDLAQALELTGAGSHPVVVRAFSVLGKLVGEGGVVHGNMMPHAKSTAQRLYAKSNMNP